MKCNDVSNALLGAAGAVVANLALYAANDNVSPTERVTCTLAGAVAFVGFKYSAQAGAACRHAVDTAKAWVAPAPRP